MESQQQVPPGIVALASPEDKTKILTFEGDKEMYSHWITSLFKNQRFTIHTISVDDKEWSIKDKTANGFTIKSFEWEGHTRNWQATFEEPSALFPKTVKTLEKLLHPSQPKPNYERLEEMLDRSGSQPGKPKYEAAKHLWENRESLDKYLTQLKEVMYKRRSNLQTNHPVELLIRSVVHEVEKLGAHEVLTNAVVKLDEVRNLVGDYIDWNPELQPQPSQPGDGKEEVKYNQSVILQQREEYRKLYEENKLLVANIKALNEALKSKPTDGWSAPSEEEINAAAKSECLRILGIHDPIGAGHKLFKAALQWLSSYKQTKS